MLAPVPEEWLTGPSGKARKELYPAHCESWKELVCAWRKAMRWTDGLDRCLGVVLAAIVSTPLPGTQLWVKVVSPASTGKSELAEAAAVSKKYIMAKSTIRGFHSGYQTDKDGKEDNSLISKLSGKTLVTKDGDTLLRSPNLEQILSEARDLFDCVSRTHYRNKQSKDYTGIRMTWILFGTSSLRMIDSSELGERFLDCIIMEDIDESTMSWRTLCWFAWPTKRAKA